MSGPSETITVTLTLSRNAARALRARADEARLPVADLIEKIIDDHEETRYFKHGPGSLGGRARSL